MSATVSIAILANAAKARAELNSVADSGSKMSSGLKKAGEVIKGGLLAAGVGAAVFAKSAVKSASEAQQSLGATETVFGKVADKIVKYSEGAADKYGLSANQYRENANLIGSLFKNQGVSTDQLAGKTDKMVSLGADLAATFGGETTDAVSALGSAFKGEYDSLEKYGISLKQSDVSARLAAKGQDNLTGKARELAEQQAITDLVMKQGKDSLGAFGRESGTLANKQQRLAAKFEDVKAKVGEKLLPILSALADWVLEKGLPMFEDWGEKITLAWENIQPLIQGVRDFIGAFKGGDKSSGTMRQIVDTVKKVWRDIKSIFRDAKQIVTDLWRKFGKDIINYARDAFRNVRQVISGAFDVIKGIFKVVSGIMRGDWKKVWSGIKDIVRGAKDIIVGIVKQFWNIIKTAFNIGVKIIKAIWSRLWDGVKTLASNAWNGIKSVVSAGVDKVVGFVRALPDKIRGFFSGAGDWLLDAGKSIIRGLLDGIESMIGSVKSKLSELTNMIPKLKGPPSKDKRLLRGAGQLLMQGLVDGIDRGIPKVRSTLQGLSREIGGFSSALSPSVALSAPHGSVNAAQATSGGNTYQITVQVPVGTPSAEVGRTLVKHIESYERAGGRRRR